MPRPGNRFQIGSGCFTCQACKRRTRDTGGDNQDVGLCAECYDLAGIENTISDKEAKDNWIRRNGHRYQIQEVFINNAWGLDVRKLKIILGGR